MEDYIQMYDYTVHELNILNSYNGVKVILEGFCYKKNSKNLLNSSDIQKSYEKNGTNVFSELCGEFAMLIHDTLKKSIHIVADPCGIVQSFFMVKDNMLYWSLDLENLPFSMLDIDDKYLANYLVGITWNEILTPYNHVKRVPGGHFVTVKEVGIQVNRYWKPELINQDIIDEDEAITQIEHSLNNFFELRFKQVENVCFEVSGGIDSSTLFALGKDYCNRSTVVSICHKGSSDVKFIRLLKNTYNSDWEIIDGDLFPSYTASPYTPIEPDSGFVTALDWHVRLKMKEMGAQLIVSGTGGDQLFGTNGNYDFLADYLMNGRIVDFVQLLFKATVDSGDNIFQIIGNNIISPIFNKPLRNKGGPIIYSLPEVPEWLNSDFAKEFNLSQLLKMTSWQDDINGFYKRRYIKEILTKMTRQQFIGDSQRSCKTGVPKTYPFMDRTVIETLLRVNPLLVTNLLKTNKRMDKYFLRKICKKSLPIEIAERLNKGSFDPLFYKGCKINGTNVWGKINNSTLLDKYINKKQLKDVWNKVSQGAPVNNLTFINSISASLWIADLENRP